MSEWTPLGAEESPDFEGLNDGVPRWLEQSLWDWISRRFAISDTSTGVRRTMFNTSLLRAAERVLRISVPYTDRNLQTGVAHVKAYTEHDEDGVLRLVDYLLSGEPGSASALETILQEAGSSWTVGDRLGKQGLLRRVPEGVQRGAEQVMASGGYAGARLAQAWTAAFGVNPDPSRAYGLAIKAVEDAMKPVVAPNDATATLGKMIGQLRSDGTWSLPFQREDSRASSGTVLVGHLQMLWSGQADRHGGDPDPDLAITQEAAEAAVVFAVPIVQAFTSGLARRAK